MWDGDAGVCQEGRAGTAHGDARHHLDTTGPHEICGTALILDAPRATASRPLARNWLIWRPGALSPRSACMAAERAMSPA